MLEIASKLCEDEKYTQALKYYEIILRIESDNVAAIIRGFLISGSTLFMNSKLSIT